MGKKKRTRRPQEFRTAREGHESSAEQIAAFAEELKERNECARQQRDKDQARRGEARRSAGYE
jgi:hypothetical protein